MSVNQATIEQALRQVIDAESGQDVWSAGWISGLDVSDNATVRFVLTLPLKDKHKLHLLKQCEQAVQQVEGVKSVQAVATAQATMPDGRAGSRWNLTPLPHVKKLIAVASGKGGVGKSTSTVQLAQALKAQGHNVGILDADIYGPSIPRMLGLADAGEPAFANNQMHPLTGHGIACMSMGFLLGDRAAVMRGPMIAKALNQLLRSTAWATEENPLDYLLIDMPPGTGDVHLTLVQQAPVNAAIVITTPQEVALDDARKCAQMFQKIDIPIAGVIENMSYFEDPSGQRHSLFGEGGGQQLATEIHAPLWGHIALAPDLRSALDAGEAYDPSAFMPMAEQLHVQLSKASG